MAVPDSLDEWAHDKIVTIELPPVGDGPVRDVEFELPDLPQYAMRGGIPNPLLSIALRVDNGLTPAKLDDEDKGSYFDLMCYVIARNLREPNLVEMCGGIDQAAEWVATKMPPEHRLAIWQRSVHIFDAADLRAVVEMAEEITAGG